MEKKMNSISLSLTSGRRAFSNAPQLALNSRCIPRIFSRAMSERWALWLTDRMWAWPAGPNKWSRRIRSEERRAGKECSVRCDLGCCRTTKHNNTEWQQLSHEEIHKIFKQK